MTGKVPSAKSLTLCVYDAHPDDWACSQQQARSLGIDAWILEANSLPTLTPLQLELPFCLRWQGPFSIPDFARTVAEVSKSLIGKGQWVLYHGHPIILLSQPKWQAPAGWLAEWFDAFVSTAGIKPILICDFDFATPDDIRADHLIRLAPAGHGAFTTTSSTGLPDFRGCLYTAYYANPIDQGYLIPLVPPAPLQTDGQPPVISALKMSNHNPGEYQKLWSQTKSISRLLATIKSTLAIRIVTSWLGHQAASHINIIPCTNRSLNRVKSNHIPSVATKENVSHAEPSPADTPFALAIHGYHIDLLLQMLQPTPERDLRPKVTLFISVQRGMSTSIARYLDSLGWQFELIELSNRGRDVLPFLLHQLPRINELGFQYFAKVHTKKSVHLKTGRDWGQWLGLEILELIASGEAEKQLQKDPSLGLMAPAGAIVPITLQLDKNVYWLETLLEHCKLPIEQFMEGFFAAGTMMLGRVKALSPLLELGLTSDDFESEAGQLDGTLAHALERMFGAACMLSGLSIQEFEPRRSFETGLGYKRSNDPSF